MAYGSKPDQHRVHWRTSLKGCGRQPESKSRSGLRTPAPQVPGGCTQKDVAPQVLKVLIYELQRRSLTSSCSDKFRRPFIATANTTAWNERFDAPSGRKYFTNKTECIFDPSTLLLTQIVKQSSGRRIACKYLLQRRIGTVALLRKM